MLLLHSPLAGSFRHTVVPPSPAKDRLLGIEYVYCEYGFAAGNEEGCAGGETDYWWTHDAHALARRQQQHTPTMTAVHVQ